MLWLWSNLFDLICFYIATFTRALLKVNSSSCWINNDGLLRKRNKLISWFNRINDWGLHKQVLCRSNLKRHVSILCSISDWTWQLCLWVFHYQTYPCLKRNWCMHSHPQGTERFISSCKISREQSWNIMKMSIIIKRWTIHSYQTEHYQLIRPG